jgi:hypothetical protein
MKRTSILCFVVGLLMTSGSTRQLTAQAPLATLTGPAVLDYWGNQFTSLGAFVPENALRTHVRTTTAQLAMFDAVSAVPSSSLGRFKNVTNLATFTTAALLAGRALDAAESSLQQGEDELESGDAVITWANIAWDAISRPNEASPALSTPAVGFMQMAITQLAVYDVAVALQGNFEPFSYDLPVEGQPDRNAAIATAAYRVLHTRIPGRAAFLDAQYASFMTLIEDNHRKDDGIALGEAVAAHYIILRANDHIYDNPVWVQPPIGPGVWVPTAPTPPVDYKMVFVPPLTLTLDEVPSYFPPPPPVLTSELYTTDFNETKALGRRDSTERTEEQRQLALWTGENSFRWEARNIVRLAAEYGLNTMQAARFFAMTFTAQADTFQVGMSAKYHYAFWRPFSAIPQADIDGNPDTIADPTWAPLLNVNHPEYPAGHGFLGGAAFPLSLQSFFGTDAVNITLDTVGVAGCSTGCTSRSYTSLAAMGADIMVARIYAGLHWRNSLNAGYYMGAAVTAHALANHFRRRHRRLTPWPVVR